MTKPNVTVFANPYEGAAREGGTVRINCTVPAADYEYVKALRVQRGTVETTLAMLWHGLVEECRARGLEPLRDVVEFEAVVVSRGRGGMPV